MGFNEVNPIERKEDLKGVATMKPRESLIFLGITECLAF